MGKRKTSSFIGQYRYAREFDGIESRHCFAFRDEDGESLNPILLARKILEGLQSIEPDRWKLDGRKFKVTVKLLDE
jgi:hypothetical protein